MKRMLLLLAVCFSFSAAHARLPYTTVYQSVRNYMENRAGYTIVEDRYKDIEEGATTYLYRTFVKGYTYMIYGFTEDDDVLDLDLYLYDSDDVTIVRSDTETDAKPVIIFTPSRTREMRVVLKNAESDTPDFASRCRFLIGLK